MNANSESDKALDNANERLQCMEIWGGNVTIDQSFTAPGIEIFVNSLPFEGSESGGGDIYYVTSCASGRISRFLLADVSGHGEDAADVAVSLRDLMRQNVNRISQESFVHDLNEQFEDLSGSSRFATAVVATYFHPKNSLAISVAGHPFPFFYRASEERWFQLAPAESESQGLSNLPFGIDSSSEYPGKELSIEVGDMFLLYSDAFIEAVNSDQKQLGMSGVLSILNGTKDLNPDEIIPFLRTHIGQLADGNLTEDDATLVLGKFTESSVKLRDNLLAPLRLFGSVADQTDLRF